MYSKEAVEVFLKDQSRLYDEPVAETSEEALEFLEDCMAVVLDFSERCKKISGWNGCRCRGTFPERTGRRK